MPPVIHHPHYRRLLERQHTIEYRRRGRLDSANHHQPEQSTVHLFARPAVRRRRRSEEGRVGNEWYSTCRSWWWAYPYKKHQERHHFISSRIEISKYVQH